MKIYQYLSYRREINVTKVNYTCNLQKVWDSSSLKFIRLLRVVFSSQQRRY